MPLPLLLWGAGAIAAAVAVKKIFFSDPPAKPIPAAKKIAVLGMQESGKTQFLKTLQGVPYAYYSQTSEDEYDEFSVTLNSGRSIKIGSGTDIGGAVHFIERYKKIASGCDAVILVFDVYKFKNDSSYNFDTRCRFDFFKNGIDISDDKKVVIGSFADKFTTDEEKTKAQSYVYEQLRSVYPNIEAHNFFMRDMRDRNQIMEVINKIFPG